MIARLYGTVDMIKPTELILNVNGVGYHLHIPFSTFEMIHTMREVRLFVYTLHREDQLNLYGFFTEKEKGLFSILMEISGIGPSMALSLLSGLSIERLIDAVQSDNYDILIKVPGIGKSKAEKLVFEMKRKMKKIEQLHGDVRSEPSPRNDAVEALVSLGFDDKRSGQIVSDIMKNNTEMGVEEIVKESLKRFSA